MRRLLSVLVCGTALVAAGAGASAPSAVEARSCAQLASSFNIQLLGDRSYGWQLGRYTAIPAKTAVVAVFSLGGPRATNGLAVYGWATRAGSRLSTACSRVQPATRQPTGSLRPAVRVQHGWLYGRKYACTMRGRFVVETRDIAGGKRVTVRMQGTGELLAVAEVGRAGGWIRGSKRCTEGER